MDTEKRKNILGKVQKNDILILLYSLVTSYAVFQYMHSIISLSSENGGSSYIKYLFRFIRQINHLEPFETIKGNMHGAVYPIFLAHLSKWLRDFSGGGWIDFTATSDDAVSLIFWVQAGFVTLLFFFLPIMLQRISKSYLAGIISPWIIFYFAKDYIIADVTYSYWAAPVLCLICFPFLCQLYLKINEQTKNIIVYFAFCSILALGCNIIRQHTGLPIIFALELWCVIRFLKQSKKKKQIVVFFCQSLFLVSLFFVEPLLHETYDLVGGPLRIENVERPWHAIWCGLGYYENPYGFEWNDEAAYAYVKTINPNVIFCSEEYFDILKERVLEVMRTDPLFVINICISKFAEAFQMGWTEYGLIIVVLGVLWIVMACIAKQWKTQRYVFQGICLGGLFAVTGTYQCIIGLPSIRYNYTSLVGFIFIIVMEILGIIGCITEIMRKTKAGLYKIIRSDNCQHTVIHQVAELRAREKDGRPVLYILCPCFNEEESLENYTAVKLGEILDQMVQKRYCSSLSRICFINDGSTDNTPLIIKALHEKDPRFCYINLSGNFGHQNALMCGLMETRDFADITISIDCDLQQDPNAMFSFLEKYYEGWDIVCGVRCSRETDGKFKRVSAEVYYALMKVLSGTDIIRNHSDYRLMSKRATDALAMYSESNLYLRGLIPTMGFNSCIIYHAVEERKFGESKYSLSKMLTLAADGITSFSIRPMTIILEAGVFISIISILVILSYFIAYLCGHVISGWTSLILSVWLLGGMIMISIGCIGEYIGKQYMEVKHRPRYIVESFVNDAENQAEEEQQDE